MILTAPSYQKILAKKVINLSDIFLNREPKHGKTIQNLRNIKTGSFFLNREPKLRKTIQKFFIFFLVSSLFLKREPKQRKTIHKLRIEQKTPQIQRGFIFLCSASLLIFLPLNYAIIASSGIVA